MISVKTKSCSNVATAVLRAGDCVIQSRLTAWLHVTDDTCTNTHIGVGDCLIQGRVTAWLTHLGLDSAGC